MIVVKVIVLCFYPTIISIFLSNFLIEMLVAAVFPLTAPDRFLHYPGPNSPPTLLFHVVFLMISNYRHKIQVMAGLHFLLDKLCT